MSKYEVVKGFIENMKKLYSVTYTDKQIRNLEILYEALESKSTIANIIPIPMGEGKSMFIEYYCRYKYDTDQDFSAVIVKSKIYEADEFCSNMGVKDSNSAVLYESLGKTDYYGSIMTFNGNPMYEFPKYNNLKALALKGFNFAYCIKYKDINSKAKEKYYGDVLIATDYDSRLCSNCEKHCPLKKLKYHIKKFRVIAITHNRLFWSNSQKEILENVLYYENEKGELLKRKLLIIDEKISMFYREVLKLTDFTKLENFINNSNVPANDKKLIKKFKKEINNLEFGQNNNDFKIVDNKINITDKFSEKLSKQIFKNEECKELETTISFLEKMGNFPKIMTYINKNQSPKNDNREISIAKYLDLSNYSQYFENKVVTDATSIIDIEYDKSKAVINKDINIIKKSINCFIPTKLSSFSKQATKNNYNINIENIGKECTSIIKQNSEIKTLILTYKWLYNESDNFFQDIEKNIMAEKESYRIIYFGEFTTGVNFLSNYQNIIFIGQLRKGSFYEKTKEFILDNNFTQEEIRYNEFLLDMIQQIGRTSYRKGITPNVFIFEKEEIVNNLIEGLTAFFNVNLFKYENNYLWRERKKRNDGKCKKNSWYWKFLVFVDKESKKLGMDKKIYKLEDIKKAIGYNMKDCKKAFLDKATNFIDYNKKEKTVVIDFEKAKYDIQFNEIDT